MRVLSTALTIFLVSASSGAFAEDYTSTTPKVLQEAAIDAVERGDGDELLLVMTEMQRREMFFFRAESDASCKRETPKVGLIAAWGKYGTARTAYGLYLRELALRNQSCTCLTGQATFDEFLTDKFQTTALKMTDTEYQELVIYVNEGSGNVRENYRIFRAANCQVSE